MKATILLAALLAAVLPVQERSTDPDPYKAYTVQLKQTEANIAATHAAIAEAQAMNEAKVEEAKEMVKEAEEIAKKVELLERVCEVYNVPVPKSMEDLEAERVADSIRVLNMQNINK
jgi:septal ring factor EnvC (AmiA/AmiB activator)